MLQFMIPNTSVRSSESAPRISLVQVMIKGSKGNIARAL